MINLILKHVKITMQDWSYGFKVVYCFDKFTKPVQTYRDEIAVYKFMAKMLDEVWYGLRTPKLKMTVESR